VGAAAGRSAVVCLTVVLGTAAPAPWAADDGPRVAEVAVKRDPTTLTVGFRVESAFDDRLDEEMAAGLPVTFVHEVEIRRRRTFWFNGLVAKKTIETTAVFDSGTRQFVLSRRVDGAPVETSTTPQPEQARRFLCTVDGVGVPLPSDLPADDRNELRLRSTLATRFLLFFPYDIETPWWEAPLPALEDARVP